MEHQTFDIVICFHDADEPNLRLLEAHLTSLCREGMAAIWHRGKIMPGDDQQGIFEAKLRRAGLVLLLISADFVASCGATVSGLMNGPGRDCPRVVPMILRPCIWSGLPYFGLRPIPASGEALVVEGLPSESRFHTAALEVRDLVVSLRARAPRRAEAPTAMQRTVIETLARLEQERYQLEQAGRSDGGPLTVPGFPPAVAFSSPSQGVMGLPAFTDPPSVPLAQTLTDSQQLGASRTILTAPLPSMFDSTHRAHAPAVCRLRASLVALMGDGTQDLSDDEVIEAAAAFIEGQSSRTAMNSHPAGLGSDPPARPPSKTVFSLIGMEGQEPWVRRR